MHMQRLTTELVLLGLAFAAPAPGRADDDHPLIHPDQIFRCLRMPVASGVLVVTEMNPYYLRGDFDGDGTVDYAVAIRGRKTKRNGVLVCSGSGRVFVLGADQPVTPPFSDMPGDNLLAPNWMIYSKAETHELGRWKHNVPDPPPRILGESIAMIWEDGISLIYWDGHGFRWAGAKE